MTKALDEAKESADLGSAKPYVDFLARVTGSVARPSQHDWRRVRRKIPETYAVIKTNFDGLRVPT